MTLALLVAAGSTIPRTAPAAAPSAPACVGDSEPLCAWPEAAGWDESPNEAIVARARVASPGAYPRYWTGRQTYWTVVGVPEDDKEGLFNDDGMLEVDTGAFSIEPFLFADGRLITWAQANTAQRLEDGELPIPTVTWYAGALRLAVTVFADGAPGASSIVAIYRVANAGSRTADVDLFVAVRPFQVLPPWQALNMVGGATAIHELACAGGRVLVDGVPRLLTLTAAHACGVTGGGEGTIADFLADGRLPVRTRVMDPAGSASGALHYKLRVAAGAVSEVAIEVPLHGQEGSLEAPPRAAVLTRLAAAVGFWRALLHRVDIRVPAPALPLIRTLRSNIAYILINADGPAIQPGSRTYARSWIRDGAMTSAALLEMGFPGPVRNFIRWYATYQLEDGRIPCCVDRRGADPTPEYDSNGEFIYAVAEYYRYTQDAALVDSMWPAVVRAAASIDELRQRRRSDAYRGPERRAYFGLMPESISHEGYARRPVHSYWDDFFALRGLVDAARLASVVGDAARAAQFRVWRDEFRGDVYASIERTMQERKLEYIPASVELGDFDPSSTAIAVTPGGELGYLPDAALRRTFAQYAEIFSRRRVASDWEAYTPYELRNVGVFVRLGETDQAWALLESVLADRRPPGWNQWPEILWRDPTAPQFVGDMPHTWIGSTYVQAVRSLFAYEREADEALVLAAGVRPEWVDAPGGTGVSQLPTYYGSLDYTMQRETPARLRVRVGGNLKVPPGGIVLAGPRPELPVAVTVNGRRTEIGERTAISITELPADVVIE
ncbi:hypothetical protein L6Q96_04520 [Candidatus Binatia bacterium]|nr:hypothetical protein [Candidatus Binatia bacterium]